MTHEHELSQEEVQSLHERWIAEIESAWAPLFDACPDAVYVYIDDEHKTCNQRAADLFGFSIDYFKQMESYLDECVAEAGENYPTVPVKAQLVDVPAHLALVDAARGAALLVVGCRRPEATYLSRVGPVASWLMHESPVPVALAGQTLQAAP